MYYLLTGKDPVPVSRSNPCDKVSKVSEKLGSIIAKATELQLESRYENTEWLKLDLESCRSKKLDVDATIAI